MSAIPPNRQSTTDDTRLRSQTRSLMRSVCHAFAFVALIGMNERVWSQTTQADADAKQCSASEPQSRNALRFVALTPLPVVPNAAVPKPAPHVVAKPTDTPPLTIADYQNYIKGTSEAPQTEVRLAPARTSSVAKHAEVFTPVEKTRLDSQPPHEPAPRVAAVREKTAPARDEWLVSQAEIVSPRQKLTAALPESPVVANSVVALPS